MSDDFHVSLGSIARFHRRFPAESPIRGADRARLAKTVRSSAAEIESRLGNPDGTAALLATGTPVSAR
ncbi:MULTISPECIES: hypothetical protein [unclassified Streptomyces]|uniref:hypothetical protein n=1 Tax=unclassified Streptomyces TaxID=2593676 RepID=UPI0011E7A42E|nr:hypothetical protein [Streptomyces sp. sk2.1]TXS72151.1 hypothetical protein EAO76_19390 [Streptomyces sp. sk2.1]